MPDKTTKTQILDIVQNSKNVFLSTMDNKGYPVTRALMNLRHKDMPSELKINMGQNSYFYFMTSAKSDKVEQINLNHKDSIYFFNPENMTSVTLRGNAEMVTNQTIKDSLWIDSMQHYFPLGKKDSNYALIKFTPQLYKMYNQQNQKLMGTITDNDEIFVFK